MALNTLKHRNITEIHGMLKRFVGPVAGFTFAIGETAEVDGVLNGQSLKNCCRSGRVRQNRVTDVAIVGNYLACVANVLAIMTAEAA